MKDFTSLFASKMAAATLLPVAGGRGAGSGWVEGGGGLFRGVASCFCAVLQKCVVLQKQGECRVRTGGEHMRKVSESLLHQENIRLCYGIKYINIKKINREAREGRVLSRV